MSNTTMVVAGFYWCRIAKIEYAQSEDELEILESHYLGNGSHTLECNANTYIPVTIRGQEVRVDVQGSRGDEAIFLSSGSMETTLQDLKEGGWISLTWTLRDRDVTEVLFVLDEEQAYHGLAWYQKTPKLSQGS